MRQLFLLAALIAGHQAAKAADEYQVTIAVKDPLMATANDAQVKIQGIEAELESIGCTGVNVSLAANTVVSKNKAVLVIKSSNCKVQIMTEDCAAGFTGQNTAELAKAGTQACLKSQAKTVPPPQSFKGDITIQDDSLVDATSVKLIKQELEMAFMPMHCRATIATKTPMPTEKKAVYSYSSPVCRVQPLAERCQAGFEEHDNLDHLEDSGLKICAKLDVRGNAPEAKSSTGAG